MELKKRVSITAIKDKWYFMILDTHSHIVFGVDDGASTIDESMQLLNLLKHQNVDAVIATPHFLRSNSSIDETVELVEQNFSILKQHISEMQMPELFLGYEVLYFKGMSTYEDLNKLTINNSNYILIEFPYKELKPYVYAEIEELVYSRGLIPIIAHVERYLKHNKYEDLVSLFENTSIKGQVVASSLIPRFSRKQPLNLIKDGFCQFIGSDTHNLTVRPPHIDIGLNVIQKKLGDQYVQKILSDSQKLYNEIKKH